MHFRVASIRSGIGECMEDRYLYKAKTIPKEKGEFNNVWVTGNLIVSNGKYYIHPVNNVVNVKNEIGRIIVMHEVIPDTICQCTGLKDKNDKLIWENDIVGLYNENKEKRYAVGSVEYGTFNCSCCDGVYGWYFTDSADIRDSGRYEVIGNIFDNPELLESEEK